MGHLGYPFKVYLIGYIRNLIHTNSINLTESLKSEFRVSQSSSHFIDEKIESQR